MRIAGVVCLCLLGALLVPGGGRTQAPCTTCTTDGQAAGPHGLHWPARCFPPSCCPDDYCPNPLPRQCWPPYPPFYRCVPAGECQGPRCDCHNKERLTWWFLPTPRALCEAIWCRP
jgi:hypothetical protein